MFKMMLNAADRVVDKLELRLSDKDRQIYDLHVTKDYDTQKKGYVEVTVSEIKED